MIPLALLAALAAATPTRPALSLVDGAFVAAAPGLATVCAAAEVSARRRALEVLTLVDGAPLAPLAGAHRCDGAALVFEPRFPLPAGGRYAAIWRPTALGIPGPARAHRVELGAPRPASPAARVLRIEPATATLPANALRLYVYFDRPMRTDSVGGHIALLDAAGRPVEAPFFVADRELWSGDGTRLTLLFDPGRVKTGLAAHDRLGRALRPGGAVRLRVMPTLPDAQGRPLGRAFERRWAVGPAIVERIEPARWSVDAPRAGTRDPLVVRLDAPVDRVLLAERMRLVDGDGRPVSGAAVTATAGDRWTFAPDRPWSSGGYRLRVDAGLEDHAGNTIAGRFDRPATEPLRRLPDGIWRRAVEIAPPR